MSRPSTQYRTGYMELFRGRRPWCCPPWCCPPRDEGTGDRGTESHWRDVGMYLALAACLPSNSNSLTLWSVSCSKRYGSAPDPEPPPGRRPLAVGTYRPMRWINGLCRALFNRTRRGAAYWAVHGKRVWRVGFVAYRRRPQSLGQAREPLIARPSLLHPPCHHPHAVDHTPISASCITLKGWLAPSPPPIEQHPPPPRTGRQAARRESAS